MFVFMPIHERIRFVVFLQTAYLLFVTCVAREAVYICMYVCKDGQGRTGGIDCETQCQHVLRACIVRACWALSPGIVWWWMVRSCRIRRWFGGQPHNRREGRELEVSVTSSRLGDSVYCSVDEADLIGVCLIKSATFFNRLDVVCECPEYDIGPYDKELALQ